MPRKTVINPWTYSCFRPKCRTKVEQAALPNPVQKHRRGDKRWPELGCSSEDFQEVILKRELQPREINCDTCCTIWIDCWGVDRFALGVDNALFINDLSVTRYEYF